MNMFLEEMNKEIFEKVAFNEISNLVLLYLKFCYS